MVLSFATSAKKLKKAWETSDLKILVREYDQETALYIAKALNILKSAETLYDVMSYKSLRPHEIDNGRVFSLSLNGRKRLTLKTLDSNGKPTKKIDYSCKHGLILEVSEHYGD